MLGVHSILTECPSRVCTFPWCLQCPWKHSLLRLCLRSPSSFHPCLADISHRFPSKTLLVLGCAPTV